MATQPKISKNFYYHEFVPKSIYETYGKNSAWFIDPKIVDLAEFYRDWFEAPVTVNNWFWGGPYSERGYRLPDSKTGAKLSQHRFGRAFDCSIKGLTANQVRKEILENSKEFMKAGLTSLEHPDYAPTWVHSDVRDHSLNTILIVKPTLVKSEDTEDHDEYFKYKGGLFLPIIF